MTATAAKGHGGTAASRMVDLTPAYVVDIGHPNCYYEFEFWINLKRQQQKTALSFLLDFLETSPFFRFPPVCNR